MSRDPEANTHYGVRLGVAVVRGTARWTAELRDNDRKQVGSAAVGDTASAALNQLGTNLVEQTTQQSKEG